jgi:O-antigen biosynthesis protein
VDAGDDNSACAFALDIVGYNKRVLEVGCGDGAFTKALSDRGCQVVGVEIDAEAAAIAEKWAQAVVVGDLGSGEVWHELEDEQFDAITFLGILEKLRDPLETVRVAVRLLKPSGIVTISVPNIAHGDVRISLLNGHFSYGGGGLLDRDQLRFFTESELRNLIRDAGLVPVEIRRVLMPLFQSELGIKRKSVPEATVKQILEDPDAETYQFVVKAILDNGTTTLTQLADRVLELQARTDYEIVRTALRHKEMHDIEELQRRNQALQQQNVALESQLRGAAGEIERKNDSMQRTETWALEMEALALAREEVISALSRELAALRVELEEIRSSAEQSRAQIDTLLKTRAFRLMSPFRRLYGRVRRGRRSMPTQSA